MALQTSLQVKNTFIELNSPRPEIRKSRTSGSITGLHSLSCSGATSPGSTDVPDLMSTNSTPAGPRKSKLLDSFVASAKDSDRTTVMIRGIPKNYDQQMLLAEVTAQGFAVNFLYLPPGKTKSNRSYGFVNFEDKFAATMFVYMFEGHRWYYEPEAKVATVGFALLQGYSQNLEFYSNQSVAKGVSHRLPWIKYSSTYES